MVVPVTNLGGLVVIQVDEPTAVLIADALDVIDPDDDESFDRAQDLAGDIRSVLVLGNWPDAPICSGSGTSVLVRASGIALALCPECRRQVSVTGTDTIAVHRAPPS